jgi:outer membrane biosynthesis protein TonB
MFTIDPKTTEKDLRGKHIFKVLLSMNVHQVATPETSLEDARSYVFFIRDGRNRISVYIGIHLLLTDRKLIYAHSANPFVEEKVSEVEDEARDFAEYMGAMMDEVHFAGMSDLEQDCWIDDQGFFKTKTQPEAAPVPEQPAVPERPKPLSVPAPHAQPPAVPEQSAPAAEAISAPEPPALPVQPVPKASPVEPKEHQRTSPMTETAQKDIQSQTPPLAASRHRPEIEQKETMTGIETPPKQAEKKRSFSPTSVVNRDREALARLLSSF